MRRPENPSLRFVAIEVSLMLVLGAWLLVGCGTRPQEVGRAAAAGDALLEGEFWRDQGLEDVIPYWTRHARDREHGAFFAQLSRTWQPQGNLHKYPGMVARHLFSYAAAYLLSGDESHLETGDEVFRWLVEHGWDHEHGGWYDELDRQGRVVADSKDLFNQTYAATGLAMYWIATRDPQVERHLDRTLQILEEHAWDDVHGGYVRSLNRDLSVRESRKDFSPQIAHVSGYLAYLYPATRDRRYLERMERIMGTVLAHMRDDQTGWVQGRFDRDWTPALPREQVRVNVGHNLETGWQLLRLHLLTGNPEYRELGLEFVADMQRYAYMPETGAWAHNLSLVNPGEHADNTPWWIQAYGNMIQPYVHRLTGAPEPLQVFRKGAGFWNRAFMDPIYGAAYLSVHLDGSVHRGEKAVRTKTSYHSMEYALLNYLYLNLWVADRPVELHYRVAEPARVRTVYPTLIEDPDVRIRSVEIDGAPWTEFDRDRGEVRLPNVEGPVRLRVTLET